MTRAILANSYLILGLPAGATPRQAWKRVEEAKRGGSVSASEATEAAVRLTIPELRLAETVFSGLEGTGSRRAEVSRIRELAGAGGSLEAWLESHRVWKEIAQDTGFEAELRRLAPRRFLRRRTPLARRFLEDVPGHILGVHVALGSAALAAKDFERSRLHARAILQSPLGIGRDRSRALRAMFAGPITEVLRAVEEVEPTVRGFEGEEPPDEASGVAWEQLANGVLERSKGPLAFIESVSPEAAESPRDAVASLLRRMALVGGRAGAPEEVTARRLVAAREQARGAALVRDLERDCADPVWALMIARALSPVADGKPERAHKKLKALARIADQPARQEWTREHLENPFAMLARVKWKPLSFAGLGCGLGYWGRRVVEAESGTYACSHGLLLFGFPVATQGAYLRRPREREARRGQDIMLGRVPGRFAPRQWKAALLLVAILLVLATAAALGLEVAAYSEDHLRVWNAAACLDRGDVENARTFLRDSEGCRGPVVRWRRDRVMTRMLLAELRTAASPADLRDVVAHARMCDGEEASPAWRRYVASPDLGIAGWFSKDMDAEVLRLLREVPRPPLVEGGAPYSVHRDPWDQDAAWIGAFAEWACRRSEGLSKSRVEVVLQAARRLDLPHLWVLPATWAVQTRSTPDPDVTNALERFLSTSLYGDWAKHFLVFEQCVGSDRAAKALEWRLRPVFLGLEPGWDLREIVGKMPADLQAVREIPGGLAPESDLRTLELHRNPFGLAPAQEDLYRRGWRRRRAHVLMARASETLDPADFFAATDALRAVADEIPEDEETVDMACEALTEFGRGDDAIQFVATRPCRFRAAYIGMAHLQEGRLDDAIAALEPLVESRLPELLKLQFQWDEAIRRARETWASRLKGLPPDGDEQFRVRRIDKGPDFSTPDEWLDRLGKADPGARRCQLRCLLCRTEIRAVRALARAHAAKALQDAVSNRKDLDRACSLYADIAGWRAHLAEGEDELRESLEALRSSAGEDVIRRVLKNGSGKAAAALAGIADAAGLAAEAFDLHAAAWERLPEPAREVEARACLKYCQDQESRVKWLSRTGTSGIIGEFARNARELLERVRDGNWPEAARLSRDAAVRLAAWGDTPQIRAGIAGAHFTAWVCDGGITDLDAAAGIVREQLDDYAGDERSLRLCVRILYSRASVRLSGDSIRQDILHGLGRASWLWYARPPIPRADMARMSSEDPDLLAATRAAQLLAAARPADPEAWTVLMDACRLRGEPHELARLETTPEAEIAAIVHGMIQVDEEALQGLWPIIEGSPDVSRFVRVLDAAVEQARTAGARATLALALVQRSQLHLTRHLARAGADEFALAIRDAGDALDTAENPETRARMIDLLARRIAEGGAEADESLREDLARTKATPLLVLAARVLGPRNAGDLKSHPDAARLRELAERQLADDSTWTSLETLAALAVSGSPALADAARKFDKELVERSALRLDHAIKPGWGGGLVAAWLAARLAGDADEAIRLEEQARELGKLEGLLWK